MVSTVVAVIGWLLFLLTANLYRVGNKQNSQETNSLAAYCLALMFSDEFRTSVFGGISRAAKEARSQGMPPQVLMYRLMQGVTKNAASHYKPDADVNTISLVTRLLDRTA